MARTKKSTPPNVRRWIAGARKTFTTRANAAQRAIATRLGEARGTAQDALGSVERVFEQRVSRAMRTLGVPSSREVKALSQEVARLQQAVEQLRRRRARA